MTILIAPDSFKDALPAAKVAEAIAVGILLADPATEVILFPLADGGEGTLDVLHSHLGEEMRSVTVWGPLGDNMEVSYSLSHTGKTAFIEMAQASGLQHLAPEKRNPLFTTTFGTGEMIADAIKNGARHIVLGIGGSATNDCGMGMLEALGWCFTDKTGQRLEPVGQNLERVSNIEMTGVLPEIRTGKISFTVICDVENPLYGPEGAAFVYGPQKGADAAAVLQLDRGLRHFSGILKTHFGKDFSREKGAGAAGGMGAACLCFFKAKLRPGIELVMELTGFEKAIPKADWIVTGEGKIDGQTLRGKLIAGIVQKARQYKIPVSAFCGTLHASPEELEAIGLNGAFSILHHPGTLTEALAATYSALRLTAFNFMKMMTGRPN